MNPKKVSTLYIIEIISIHTGPVMLSRQNGICRNRMIGSSDKFKKVLNMILKVSKGDYST